MTVKIERLAVIGVGLIGGSFALALKEKDAVGFVAGCGRSRENLEDALAMSIIDDATHDPAEAVEGADVVMLAVPVREVPALCQKIRHVLKKGAVVTDAGSTKEVVIAEMFAHLPPYVNVVGGHPIAGREKTGARAATADLFRDRLTILTPDKTTEAESLKLVRELWETVGSRVELMDPATHDRVLGAVSHLPHMVAYALIGALMEWDRELPMLRFSAGGLGDFTRIAASSPEMWRDICLDNKDRVLEAMDRFIRTMTELRAEVDQGKGDQLQKRFAACREVRRRIGKEGS